MEFHPVIPRDPARRREHPHALSPVPGVTSVAVFAQSPVIAKGFAELLAEDTAISVVGATTEIAELVSFVVDLGATVVVTELVNDVDHPDHLLDVIASAARHRHAPVATVCVIPSAAALAGELRRRGAAAVLTMADEPDALRTAVLQAASAAPVAPDRRPAVPATRGAARDDFNLTARELDVLRGMVDGHSSKVIAEKLGVSVNTVRTHVQRLLPKLGAHNRLRATAVAIDAGLVTPSARRPARPFDDAQTV